MSRLIFLSLPAVLLCSSLSARAQETYLRAPAGKEYARVVPGGTTILPNGRFLTPKGQRLYTGGDLWNVAIRPDGKVLAAFSKGGIMIYSLPAPTGAAPRVISTRGLAPVGIFTRDGSRLIVSNGDEYGIEIYDTQGWDIPLPKSGTTPFVKIDQRPILTISAKDKDFEVPYINDLALSADEKWLFGVDVAHQRVVTFDMVSGKVASSVPAGREPYALAYSGATNQLFIANIGIFDYTVVPPPITGAGDNRGLSRPPFGFPSKESEVGTLQEGRKVSGLGKPYVPDAQSVWQYDVSTPNSPKVTSKATAGILIHAPAEGGKSVGGSAPNKLLLFGKKLYVANANNDTVQVFAADTLKAQATIKLTPSPLVAKYRGVIPSGMAINKAGTRLYVSESGLNAVAVIDTATNAVLGHIPTGWFPVQIALSPDETTLYIGTQKGVGRGPQGPKQQRTPDDERFGWSEMPGMVDAVRLPDEATLNVWTREVLSNNGIVDHRSEIATLPAAPFSRLPGKASDKIKYVVFITKENHTFDGIFGGIKGAKGEPDYAEFGMQGWITEKGKAERTPIMPNHIRLAEQFAISDNFYMEPQGSGDGHRWLIGVYPSLWTTRVYYSGWNTRAAQKAKGRLVSFGSNGSQIPEDYLENGSIWEHLQRGNITFRNYGEGYELPLTDEGPMLNKAGTYYPVNFPMPKVLFDNTCFDFPAYNNFIPDIARADWFVEDIVKYRKKNNGALPRFLNIAICNDHGFDPRPKDGYPYVCSGMADNDLALGRIVDYLSHQPEWKNMAIFVTQDDSGGDNDHVDRHRSFVLCISPYAKHGYVSKDHSSIMSIIKTIYLIFGLGPNNMFDALATDLADMLTETPDFTPYVHVPSNRAVFREEETFDPTDPNFARRRKMTGSVKMDDPKFIEWLRTRGPRPVED